MSYFGLEGYWLIAGAVAAVALLISFCRGSSSVWGSVSTGIIIGLGIVGYFYFKTGSLYWIYVLKSLIACIIFALTVDMISGIGRK